MIHSLKYKDPQRCLNRPLLRGMGDSACACERPGYKSMDVSGWLEKSGSSPVL